MYIVHTPEEKLVFDDIFQTLVVYNAPRTDDLLYILARLDP